MTALSTTHLSLQGSIMAKAKSSKFHGQAKRGKKSAEYIAWINMVSRCHGKAYKFPQNYRERGIYVCKRWRVSFANFLQDMGPRPTSSHSLDRRKNNKGYTPSNCRWATRQIQNENRRSVRFLTFQGERLNITQWAAKLGLHKQTILSRLRVGWSTRKTLTTPSRQPVVVSGRLQDEKA